MKILELSIRNLRKIEAIDISPTGNVIKIEGPNNQGKSTVLDSIFLTLGGGKIPDGVIKDGKDKSVIFLKFGDYIVKKTITAINTYLSVETKDGMKLKNPQTFLSDLVGKIAFDPMEFMRMDSKKQVDILKKVTGVEEKINKLKDEESASMEERKLVGREKDKLTILCKDKIDPVNEPVSTSDIVTEIKRLTKTRDSLIDQRKEAEQLKSVYVENCAKIEELENQIKSLKESNVKTETYLKSINFKSVNQQITDIENDINQKNILLENQDKVNNDYAKYKEYMQHKKEYEEVEKNYISLDKKVESIREEIKKTLSSNKLPVENLEINDNDELLYEGHSFANTCDSSKLKVSVSICMKLNPKLKVILIREGSLLDDSSLKEIQDIANKEDYQIWIEKVCSEKDDENAIYIVEGEIKKEEKR
ncbi:MAG TPA: AAA family ATPase [Candidatus Nanoarchaeia archaeon]|nr:AAA family ATPase [Candidatus Nanoarchaeia archaeon]